MKDISYFFYTILIGAALIGAGAYFTKPTDQECISQCATHQGGVIGDIGNSLHLSRYAYRVEDNIFYKSIYSEISGHLVAKAFFNSVFFEDYTGGNHSSYSEPEQPQYVRHAYQQQEQEEDPGSAPEKPDTLTAAPEANDTAVYGVDYDTVHGKGYTEYRSH